MKKTVIFLFAIAASVVLFYVYNTSKSTPSVTTGDSTYESLNKANPDIDKSEPNPSNSYKGVVLAGKSAPYLDFQKEDYDKAVSDGKIIILNFYASWCPICRAEAPALAEGFNALNYENIVGFRVNFNDPDTDDHEKSLAQQFNVPYQHTKIILKDGKETARYGSKWAKEDLIAAVEKVLSK